MVCTRVILGSKKKEVKGRRGRRRAQLCLQLHPMAAHKQLSFVRGGRRRREGRSFVLRLLSGGFEGVIYDHEEREEEGKKPAFAISVRHRLVYRVLHDRFPPSFFSGLASLSSRFWRHSYFSWSPSSTERERERKRGGRKKMSCLRLFAPLFWVPFPKLPPVSAMLTMGHFPAVALGNGRSPPKLHF